MANYEIIRRNFSPAAVGSTETTTIYTAAKGQRVIGCSLKMITPAASSTSSTITVGDATDPDGFAAAADMDLETTAAAAIVKGTGAYVAATDGRLYTASTAIQVVYTPNTGGATTPVIGVALVVIREWPAG